MTICDARNMWDEVCQSSNVPDYDLEGARHAGERLGLGYKWLFEAEDSINTANENAAQIVKAGFSMAARAGHAAVQEAFKIGVDLERKSIAIFLRGCADSLDMEPPAERALERAASDIERGEHAKVAHVPE
jgi:hypothetical protein